MINASNSLPSASNTAVPQDTTFQPTPVSAEKSTGVPKFATAKKKFDWKMIFGVLALLIIVVGSAAAFFLSREGSDLRQQADVANISCAPTQQDAGGTCGGSGGSCVNSCRCGYTEGVCGNRQPGESCYADGQCANNDCTGSVSQPGVCSGSSTSTQVCVPGSRRETSCGDQGCTQFQVMDQVCNLQGTGYNNISCRNASQCTSSAACWKYYPTANSCDMQPNTTLPCNNSQGLYNTKAECEEKGPSSSTSDPSKCTTLNQNQCSTNTACTWTGSTCKIKTGEVCPTNAHAQCASNWCAKQGSTNTYKCTTPPAVCTQIPAQYTCVANNSCDWSASGSCKIGEGYPCNQSGTTDQCVTGYCGLASDGKLKCIDQPATGGGTPTSQTCTQVTSPTTCNNRTDCVWSGTQNTGSCKIDRGYPCTGSADNTKCITNYCGLASDGKLKCIDEPTTGGGTPTNSCPSINTRTMCNANSNCGWNDSTNTCGYKTPGTPCGANADCASNSCGYGYPSNPGVKTCLPATNQPGTITCFDLSVQCAPKSATGTTCSATEGRYSNVDTCFSKRCSNQLGAGNYVNAKAACVGKGTWSDQACKCETGSTTPPPNGSGEMCQNQPTTPVKKWVKFTCPNGCTLSTGDDGVTAYRCYENRVDSNTPLDLLPGECGQVDQLSGDTDATYCGYQPQDYTCDQTQCQKPPETPTYQCNSNCTTDAQCKTADTRFMCSSGKCRLGTNPTSETCQNPTGPQCLTLRMNNLTRPDTTTAKSNPRLSETVNFVCGQVEAAHHYVFKIVEPDGTIKRLKASDVRKNQSVNYVVRKTGRFYAQCQICTGANDNTCLPFEPLNQAEQNQNSILN
jgi:hypothetical protein